MTPSSRSASATQVVVAFAVLYIVWGSTYFAIRVAVGHIPPLIVGSIRFIIAGAMMLTWCAWKKEKIFSWKYIKPAAISGFFVLFIGNGGVMWGEQYLPSSLAAIVVAGSPLWYVVLDYSKWSENLRSKETLIGLLVGFGGMFLLFGEGLFGKGVPAADHMTAAVQGQQALAGAGGVADSVAGAVAAGHAGSALQEAVNGAGTASGHMVLVAMGVLLLSSVCWVAGALYSKYKSTAPSTWVNAGWQMFAAGMVFIPASAARGEFRHFHLSDTTPAAWMGVAYLVTFGSLAGYSSFAWLMQNRPATQVSTYAYVNPVVAVLLGVLFAGEHLSLLQLLGLGVILVSVLLINLSKYRSAAAQKKASRSVEAGTETLAKG